MNNRSIKTEDSGSDFESLISEAINEFAAAIVTDERTAANMTRLAEATAELPLNKMVFWEQFIRIQFAKAMGTRYQLRWKPWGSTSQVLTWLDLVSCDGYTREKTLLTLTGPAPNRFFFALVLRRLNDWVPQVREAARKKILELLDVSEPVDVVEAMCLTLYNWNSWGRMRQTDKNIVLEILARDNIVASMKSKIISSPSGPMALLFSQSSRISCFDEHILTIAEQAVQPMVRAKAFRCLFEQKVVWTEGKKWQWIDIRYCKGRYKSISGHRAIKVNVTKLDLLFRSAQDSSSLVRRVSAEFLIKYLDEIGPAAKQLAEQFSADRSAPVAERGQFALRKISELKR